jgi:hypothetical protein
MGKRGRNRWHQFIQAKLSAVGTTIEVKIVADGLTEEEALKLEIERIAFWKNDGADLCNITAGGDSGHYMEWSDEMRRRQSERLKGRKMSDEARANMSKAAMGNKKGLGKKKPQHVIDALIARNTGLKRSPEVIAKLSAIRKANPTFLGRHHTPEAIEKIKAKQRGVPKAEWIKERMRKPKSAIHREKIRALMTGVKRSAETRAKIAENSRLMWARKKAEKALANME